MQSQLLYDSASSIYPGGFEPPETTIDLKDMADAGMPLPAAARKAVIRCVNDCYLVEAELPGFLPEEIMVNAEDSILVIAAFQKLELQGHRFVKTRLSLPSDLDADFSSARYHHGLLQIVFHKTDHAVQGVRGRIVVYGQ